MFLLLFMQHDVRYVREIYSDGSIILFRWYAACLYSPKAWVLSPKPKLKPKLWLLGFWLALPWCKDWSQLLDEHEFRPAKSQLLKQNSEPATTLAIQRIWFRLKLREKRMSIKTVCKIQSMTLLSTIYAYEEDINPLDVLALLHISMTAKALLKNIFSICSSFPWDLRFSSIL